MTDLRERLKISEERLKEVNDFILDPNNELINKLLEIVEKYGGPEEIINQGLMDKLELSYLDKHDALNRTAEALTKAGIGVVCAWKLHEGALVQKLS